MNMAEEFLFNNRAVIYDIACIFGVIGFLLGLIEVHYAKRWIALCCGWMFACALLCAGFICATESHYTFVHSQSKRGISPYFLAGYYCAK